MTGTFLAAYRVFYLATDNRTYDSYWVHDMKNLLLIVMVIAKTGCVSREEREARNNAWKNSLALELVFAVCVTIPAFLVGKVPAHTT